MNGVLARQHGAYYSAFRWAPALAVAFLLVAHDPGRLWMAFGPSHDGFNASLFMLGGRAIVEEGPLASHLGASSRTVAGDQVIYAHHPPLLYIETAAALAVTGMPELAARLPAVMSSLLVLVIVVLLLADCGLRPGPAAVGLLAAFATPMFVAFGVVTEPDALGLAPIAALALLWQRTRRGVEARSWALASVAAAATLTSWHAALFTAFVTILLFLDNRRRAAAAVFTGTAVSAALIVLWMWWAYHGELGEFFQRALHRVGTDGAGRVSLRQAVAQQMLYFSDLFPVGTWLVVPIAGLGLLDRRTRPLVAASLGSVLVYAVLFKNGAYDHSYWLYCILLPFALSVAVSADAIARFCTDYRWRRPAPMVLGATLVVALGFTVWSPSGEESHHRNAAKVGAQARTVSWPPRQRYAYDAFGHNGTTDLLPWLLFYSRRQPFGVAGPESVPSGEILLRMVDGDVVVSPGAQPRAP